MRFKYAITLTCFVLVCSVCVSQNKDVTIFGNWQEIEYHGNDGSKDYVQKIENGRILIFENNSVSGNKGTYEIKGDSLHILLPKSEAYYRISYQNDNMKRLSFTPVTNKYEYVCDEGCASVFEQTTR